MPKNMKLISLNIEQGKHFNKHKQFLLNQKPDILCLQELPEKDIKRYKKLLNFNFVIFEPKIILKKDDNIYKEGTAIFSKIKPFMSKTKFILKHPNKNKYSIEGIHDTYYWKVLIITINIGVKKINIANIHGIDTERGDVSTPKQLQYFKNLIKILKPTKNLILVGDSNAPRGYEAFSIMEEKLKDNIPKKYTTSIDNKIHRAGFKNLQYVIDILFTKGDIKILNTKYQNGLSDHFGLITEFQ